MVNLSSCTVCKAPFDDFLALGDHNARCHDLIYELVLGMYHDDLQHLPVLECSLSLDPSDIAKTPAGTALILVHRDGASGTLPCPHTGCNNTISAQMRGLKRHMKKDHAYTWTNEHMPTATAESVTSAIGPVSDACMYLLQRR